MKKRIITLLAVLALLVTCAVFAVQAEEAAFDESTLCPCGCEKTMAEILTTNNGKFAYNAKGINSGHYIFTATAGPGAALTINADQTVVVYMKNATLGKESTPTDRVFQTINVKTGATLYIVGNGGAIATAFPYKTTAAGKTGNAINIASGATVELSGNLTIRPGNSVSASALAGSGALIYNQGTLTIKDGVTINGVGAAATGDSNGGAIYTTGANARINMEGGTINANADFDGSQGAAVAVYGGATFNMTGGTIVNASAKSGVRVQNATFYMQGGEVKANAATQRAFSITGYGAASTLLLAGDAKVSNLDGVLPASTPNVLFSNVKNGETAGYAYLQVANDWTGYANIDITASSAKTYGKTYGANELPADSGKNLANCGKWDADTETFTKGGGHKGNLVAGGIDSDPSLYGNSGLLMVMRVLLIGEKEGKSQTKWYITAETALSAQKTLKWDNAYVRLCCDTGVTVPAGVTAVVDLNGVDCTSITLKDAKSTLYIWDQDADFETMAPSSATVTGEGAETVYQRGSKTYVLNNGKVYPVTMEVTHVSLRPTTGMASLYYTATVNAAEEAGLTAWGLAVTLEEDATTLDQHLYTVAETKADFNGVLIKNIVSEGKADNAERAAQNIIAKAYITVGEKTVFSAPVEKCLNDVVASVMALEEANLTEAQIAARAAMQTYGWYTELYATAE